MSSMHQGTDLLKILPAPEPKVEYPADPKKVDVAKPPSRQAYFPVSQQRPIFGTRNDQSPRLSEPQFS